MIPPNSPQEVATGNTHLVQDKCESPDTTKPVVLPSSDNIACPAPPLAAPRAPRASAPRSRGMRSFVVAAARRSFHIARPPRRGPGLSAARSPRAHPEAVPAQSPRVNAGCGQNLQEAPNHARRKASRGHHVSPGPRRSAAPQARDPPRKTVVVDMDGVPHVFGGLAEASFGRKDLLFAREVCGDPAEIFNGVKTERHPFFPYPAPNMLESNREFDQELEDSLPIFWGFDQEVIERQVDLYAEQTRIFEQVMAEHDAEFYPAHDRVLYLKNQLTYLNDRRQRAITSEYAQKPVMTPQERAKLLAEIAAAERPFLEERELAHSELKEIILRGRVKIARALQKDLRADNEIDQRKSRVAQRKATEEESTEMGVAGAMIGLRGSLKRQTEKTRTEVLQYAQRVIDAKMKEFDESDPAFRPAKSAKPASGRLPSVDNIVTSIPAWFTILDAKGTVALSAPTPMGRFKELLHCMGNASYSAREEQWLRDARPEKLSPAKEYHEPHDGWPTAKQRARGGWWTCRSGPDASPAERNCELCHSPEAEAAAALEASIDPRAFRDRYQHISDEVEKAMAEANVRDRLMLKHNLEQERQDIERYWQHREWMRSGGGNISEVLHTPDVNHLNYRPSAARSQSWHEPSEDFEGKSGEPPAEDENYVHRAVPHRPGSGRGRTFHGSELLCGRSMNENSAPRPSPSQRPRHLEGSQFHELLVGRATENSAPQSSSHPAAWPLGIHGQDPGGLVLAHRLLSGRRVKAVDPYPPVPVQSLNRDNSDRVHDLLHGRSADKETSPVQPALAPLRSALLPPGYKSRKPKRVSWQY
ncbi:hypothetical protein C8A05DRAFT_12510 [Staphylotrichum tortipilum]|uniref:Uncharacterized protein n=1 Tax=Staphylotrichum tortipilum TaxID=2831512 RepID=A0AAN6RW71_9PEZI|nr:hypothetical protein C8A05DRAFT_12510 [Staphylotrichum longicolle]